MINEEISKEAGQAAQTIITYTIKAAKETINLDKEIRKKVNDTLEKANGNLKSLMGDEMKIKDLYKKRTTRKYKHRSKRPQRLKKRTKQTWSKFLSNENQINSKLWSIFQAKDIKVMEYDFK